MQGRFIPLVAAVAFATPAAAETTTVKGLNPAEVNNRADLIFKAIDLPQGDSLALVPKIDRKFGRGIGANLELPILSRVRTPEGAIVGNGDLFGRVQYSRPVASRFVGLIAVEAVVPLASSDFMGAGKWQLNPAVGFVHIWSPRSFSAVILKHSFSIAGDSKRQAISVNQVRGIHSYVLDRGWYVSMDAKQEWQTLGADQAWTTAEFEVGRQFRPDMAASARLGRTYGDRPNQGSIQLNLRRFF